VKNYLCMKHLFLNSLRNLILAQVIMVSLHGESASIAEPSLRTSKLAKETYVLPPGEKEFEKGRAYERGIGVTQSYEKALLLYKKSADKGNLKAMLNLGVLYLAGKGVAEDDKTGFSWVRKAAEGGDPRAAYSLSILFRNGQGTDKDPAQARIWLQRSSDGSLPLAMMEFGQELMVGTNGVSQDIPHGLDLLKRAATATNSAACMLLFKHYDEQFIKDASDRKIQSQDRADSLVWLGKGAAYGDPAAQYEYAHQLMAAGKPSAAYPWAKLATDAHVPFANGIMNECIADIPSEQVTSGDKEAERIKAAYPKENH